MARGTRVVRWFPLMLAASAFWGCRDVLPPPDDLEASRLEPSPTAAAGGFYSIDVPGIPAVTIGTGGIADGPLARDISRRFPSLVVSDCLERAAAAHHSLPLELAGNPPLSFTEFALHWAGCPDPSAAVTTILTSDTGRDVLYRHLRNIVKDGDYTHVGIARAAASPPYANRWYGLLVHRQIEMKAVSAVAEPGASVPLQFRLEGDFNGAVIAVTAPNGEVRTSEPGVGGSWVVASVDVGARVGETWVELLGHNSEGPQVLALFPIQVGRSVPDRWVGRPVADESWIRSADEAEGFAAGLIQADRRRFGLPDLSWDPELARVARGHSADMSDNDFFAHVSPTSGTIMDRLRRSGYPTSMAMENIAMAPTLAEAQESLMRSPGHRAAILSPEATHFGVGVATRTVPGHGTVRHLTQIYARREASGQTAGR